ncbi:ABC transporter G family member 9 [Cocos nucifera]|uniref:ABC transporter G family member 9 n=1 Tax=Cocos nucifera TaxID=13894 RepID=A0A8K0IAR7_COCNU|nr:ABC transporter G family member 9 [Cocos nucifera]
MMETEMQARSQLEAAEEGAGRCSIFAKASHPVTLQFEDVVYKIKTKAIGSKKGEKAILKGVSGAVLPGEMLAIMGPSGSGKTTLLTALGGRLARPGRLLSGSISYNGRPFSNSLRRNMGFVNQDDILYPHLTVSETLLYTALLRLPRTLSRDEKATQAEAVMAELRLLDCRNSMIGGSLVRGISGGERKRVSIGQELLINPSLLLLDKPTSGLDSTIAGRIVTTIADLTRGGRTVLMTIHQPSSRIFYMFHRILLLSDGHTVYFGKGSDAMNYFASIGYAPAVPMNPADFLLDLADGLAPDETLENRAALKETLFSAYSDHLHDQIIEELRGVGRECKESEPRKTTNEWCTTWWEQFSVLLRRDMKERKHQAFSGLQVAQILVTAFLGGFMWFGSGGHVQDQMGLLYFVLGFWSFYPAFQAIFTFPQERTMLTKERVSGMYRLSSYYVARMVGDLPMELILPIVFVTITYWLGGLKRTASSFFITLSVMLLEVLIAQGLGFALGAMVMDLKASTKLASVILLSFMVAGGYYVQHVPRFIAWIKYISYTYYTFKIQISAQFYPGETYQCSGGHACRIEDVPMISAVGFDHRGLAVGVLFMMLIIFRVAAYVALMRIGRTSINF